MHDYMQETLRLYAQRDDGLAFIWIYGFTEGEIHVDSGMVGAQPDRKTHPLSNRPAIDDAITQYRKAGFAEVDEDDMAVMEIIFDVEDGFATDAEFNKRNALWDALDEFLALTGQGWVDGASSGMGTMEICFMSVNPDISKATIADWLKDTEWSDYKSID